MKYTEMKYPVKRDTQLRYDSWRKVGSSDGFGKAHDVCEEIVERLEANYLQEREAEYKKIEQDALALGKETRKCRPSLLRAILENLLIAVMVMLFFYLCWLGVSKLWHIIFH